MPTTRPATRPFNAGLLLRPSCQTHHATGAAHRARSRRSPVGGFVPSTIAFIVTLAAFAGAPSWAAPIIVDSSLAWEAGACTLESAVATAQTALDVEGCSWQGEPRIEIAVGSVALDSEIMVSGSVEIDGAGAVLQRAAPASLHRFFQVTGALELRRLVIVGGHHTTDGGGAVKVHASGLLTVSATTFSGNQTARAGGAILNQGQTIVQASEFLGNVAIWRGGAIHSSSGSLVVERSTLANNLALQFGGGAVSAESTSLTIENATVSANVAAWAGALDLLSGQADVNFSTFAENVALQANAANTLSIASGGTIEIARSVLQSDDSSRALCAGPVTSLDWNAASDASCDLNGAGDQESVPILLSDLVDHGGPTQVHVPLCNGWIAGACQSPLIDQFACDALPTASQPPRDQRDQMPRRVTLPSPHGYPETGPLCDIGAYESSCETTYWATPGEDQVVRFHREQSATSTDLLDNGACYAHELDFSASSGCSIRWEIYGGGLEITDIVFVDPACPHDCFEDPESCALSCAIAAPAGWTPVSPQPAGGFAMDVPCSASETLSSAYVVEYIDSQEPLSPLYWDPRMIDDPPI
ncbi:MAG: hypothetical protein AAGN46_13445 [Acidobacteriota bacterium]